MASNHAVAKAVREFSPKPRELEALDRVREADEDGGVEAVQASD